MTRLEVLLCVKIGFTVLTCLIPMLALRPARVAGLFGVEIGAVGLIRLYGIALAALLVGYGSGLVAAGRGEFPQGIVLMGILSNLGASGYLFATGEWRRMPPLPIVFGLIGAGLVWALAAPDTWMASIA